MSQSLSDQIALSSGLLQVRDTYRDLLGNARYEAKIDELRPVFALVMDERQCNEFEVVTHLTRGSAEPMTDWHVAQFISAAVELIEARQTPAATP